MKPKAGTDLNFSDIRMILGEANMEVRNAMRMAFQTLGFREVMDAHKVSTIEHAVSDNQVDLVICDIDLPDGDLTALTRRIRHHEIGDNPFVVIVATIGTPTRELIMKVIDSGADDLLIKPVSPAALMERITLQARHARHFVVTTSYIGPDRRKNARADAIPIPEIDVPNVIRAKAVEHLPPVELQREIDDAINEINEQKMLRHSVQISWLVDRINPMYLMGAADEDVLPLLSRLVYVSEDLSRRLIRTRFEHVGELCRAMVGLVRRIRKQPLTPDPKDVRLLPQLADAIRAAFAAVDQEVQVARDITRTVEKNGS